MFAENAQRRKFCYMPRNEKELPVYKTVEDVKKHFASDDEDMFDPMSLVSKEERDAVIDSEVFRKSWFTKESVAWNKRMLGEDDKEKPAGGLDLFNLSSSDDDIMQMIEKHQREEAEKAAAEEAKKPEVIEVSDSTDLF